MNLKGIILSKNNQSPKLHNYIILFFWHFTKAIPLYVEDNSSYQGLCIWVCAESRERDGRT